jgi:hypothetical protein
MVIFMAVTSEFKQLINVLISLIPSDYKTVDTVVKEATIKNGVTIPTTKVCQISITPLFNLGRCTDSGKYTTQIVRVTFNIYGEANPDGLENMRVYMDTLKNTLDTTFNKEFVDPLSGNEFIITNLQRDGIENPLGWNSQGIPVYSINYKLHYSKGGN